MHKLLLLPEIALRCAVLVHGLSLCLAWHVFTYSMLALLLSSKAL